MDPLLTAFALGAAGQGIRVLIGLHKWWVDPSRYDGFSWRYMASSIVMGAVAGGVASFVDQSPLLLLGAGYAGTDAIEGVFTTFRPKR